MTLSTTAARITYAGDGVTTSFAVPFVFFGADEIAVIDRDQLGGAETDRTLITDYSVAGGGGETGTVTALVPPAVGHSWTIYRRTQRTQMIDYTPNDPFPAETHERALDRLTALVQELDDKIDRTATLSPTSTLANLTLPPPAADKLIGWRSDLSGLENKSVSGGGTVYASIAATRDGSGESEAVTPRGLAALWRKGADIASAPTLAAPGDIGRGGYHVVTGTSSIAALWPGGPSGETVELRFAGSLSLSHHATQLILPGGVDVTTRAGDVARFRAEGGGNWRCVAAPPHWHGGGGLAVPVDVKGGSHAMVAADAGRELAFTVPATLALLAAATAGNGTTIALRNLAASGDVVIDPAGAETLDGLAQRRLRPGDCVILRCDGSGWRTLAGSYGYDSGEQTIVAGGLLTLSHDLGVMPQGVEVRLRCKTAEGGFAVGDECQIAVGNYMGIAVHRAANVRVSDAAILIRTGSSGLGVTNPATGAETSLTPANFRYIVKARAS
jgi:hypothetical protein